MTRPSSNVRATNCASPTRRSKAGCAPSPRSSIRLPFPVWQRDEAGALSLVNRAYVEAVEGDTPEAVVAAGTELLDATVGGSTVRRRLPGARNRAADHSHPAGDGGA